MIMKRDGTLVDFCCPSCGAEPNTQNVSATEVTCTECSTTRPYVRPDIVNVTGCPGTGKTAAARTLLGKLRPEFVMVETDLLHQPSDSVDEHTWMSFIERLLRLAVCLAHGGHTLVLVGYSTPWQWDGQPLRHFLGNVHHLALVCSDAELERRLRARRWLDPSEHEGLLGLNRQFHEMQDVSRFDTTAATPEEAAEAIRAFIAGITSSRSHSAAAG